MKNVIQLIKKDQQKIVGSLASALIGAICFKYFVFATNIIPAGFSGLALVLNRLTSWLLPFEISIGMFMFLLNVPAFLLAYFGVGKKFSVYSFLNTSLTSFLLDLLTTYAITKDQFLLVVIGAIIGGIATGIALRVDTCTGGTDFITLYFSVKKNKEVWNYSLAFNIMLLLCALVIYGFDGVAYSIVYQLIYTYVVKMMHTRYHRKMLFVFTNHGDEIADVLISNVQRGATLVNSVGAYSKKDNQMLISVVSTAELDKVVRLIREVDEHAFISVTDSERIYGAFYQLPFE